MIAGPITLVLISLYFSPEVQGWFYVFAEILALQSLVEMSLHQIIINVASHEWSRLEQAADGSIVGDPNAKSRLVSLGRFFAKWYLGVAILYLLVIGVGGGFWMASNDPAADVAWIGPWIVVTICTVLSLWLMPIYALLEGCNQVIATNRFRVLQSVLGNLVVWMCIPLGAGLWTTVGHRRHEARGRCLSARGTVPPVFRRVFSKARGTGRFLAGRNRCRSNGGWPSKPAPRPWRCLR